MTPAVRRIEARDQARWRELWDRARGLYDKYTRHSGFVRYVISNPVT